MRLNLDQICVYFSRYLYFISFLLTNIFYSFYAEFLSRFFQKSAPLLNTI